MDPVTGVGLAASVIQLVHFALGLVKNCRELSEKGSTSDHVDLQFRASQLSNLTNSLQQSLQQAVPPSCILNGPEQDLANLARNCEDCAVRLKHEVEKYQLPSKRSSLKAIGKSLGLMIKGGEIEKLQKQFQQYQDTLQMSLLHRLSQKFDVQALKNDKNFAEMDQHLQSLIHNLACQQTSLSDLMKDESKQTRSHIDTIAFQLGQIHLEDRVRREEEIWYDELTQSLFYPEITSRQEQIEENFEGIENSYDWIFDEPLLDESGAPKWTNFFKWLQSGESIYWIHGKAGSGKSTLMSRICSHEQTGNLLQEWSNGEQLLTPTHFFWNAGSRLQKSIDGLLRSLIYQILMDCRPLARCIKRQTLHTWTEKRLLDLFCTLLKQNLLPIRICIFVDGLDEYEGDYKHVVRTLLGLSGWQHVKICLSSRPLLDFVREFVDSPRLKLQDLTFSTIREYAEHQLLEVVKEHFASQEVHQHSIVALLRKIVDNADGVFLWAVIAVRTLRDGLLDYANLDDLESAIDSLPDGIENLYLHILQRIKPAYKREAIRFLQIMLYSVRDGYDICTFCFIDLERTSRDIPLTTDVMDPDALFESCDRLKMRLNSHTLGLVDVAPHDERGYIRDGRTHFQVRFHHRSVRDFLYNSQQVQELIASIGWQEHEIHLSISRGILRYIAFEKKLKVNPKPVYLSEEDIKEAFNQIAAVEELTERSQSQLLNSLHQNIPLMILKRTDFVFYLSIITPGGGSRDLMDPVVAAVQSAMLHYVCETLGIKELKPSVYPRILSDVQQHHCMGHRRTDMIEFSSNGDYDFHPSQYERSMSECLSWARLESTREFVYGNESDKELLASYLLYFSMPGKTVRPSQFKLAEVLLQLGANPMAQLKDQVKQYPIPKTCPRDECFFRRWLHLLWAWRFHLKTAFIEHEHDLWQTTRLLLACGGDINYKIQTDEYRDQSELGMLFKHHRDYCFNNWQFHGNISAMHILLTCFGHYPECSTFAETAAMSIKRPWRKMYSISRNWLDCKQILRLRNEEEDSLWDVIDAEEEMPEKDWLKQVRSALEKIWNDRHMDIAEVPRTKSGNESSSGCVVTSYSYS